MKLKKGILIVLIILLIFFLMSLIFLSIDYTRVKNGETPKFSISNPGGMPLDGGTEIYLGLGYKIIDFNKLSGYDEVKIGSWFTKPEDFKEEYEAFEEENKPVIIKSEALKGDEKETDLAIYGEARLIENIINCANFTTENGGGIVDYSVTLRNGKNYGIKIFENSCHITSEGKEATLNAENSYDLIRIINKYSRTVDNNITTKTVNFVRTYNIKEKLKETDTTGQYNYYVISQFQTNELALIKIENTYKLEESKNYEFSFEGTKINEQDYTIQEIFSGFKITNIKQTNKLGLEQRQDSI